MKRLERIIRTGWTADPGRGARGTARLFGSLTELRIRLYDRGTLPSRRAPIPIVSVGGLTVGGSGKTPIAAQLARWLAAAGRRPAIITRGYADELEVHRRLAPAAVVVGHKDRIEAARAAAEQGAGVGILDDGFQTLRVARELDVLLVDIDATVRTNGRLLPAGPFREPLSAARRADFVALTGRAVSEKEMETAASRLRELKVEAPIGRVSILPGDLLAFNAAADVARPARPFALTTVMKPRLFFGQLRAIGIEPAELIPLSDHAVPDRETLTRVAAAGSRGGVVCTLKDAVKLVGRLADEIPIWYVADEIHWHAGREQLHDLLLQVAEPVRA